jgi:hypothetical protein
MMMPEVGGSTVVSGRSMAIPEDGPMPGSTPIRVPIRQPIVAHSRFSGVRAVAKPLRRNSHEKSITTS